MDMKVDLGLLYFLLCILILFVNWMAQSTSSDVSTFKMETIKRKRKNSPKLNSAKNQKEVYPVFISSLKVFFGERIPSIVIQNRLVVLMGILLGFSLGIKLTALFFFFALMAAIWYMEGKTVAFLGAFFMTIGIMFLLRLDEQPQLRQLHQNVSILQWILLIVGIGFVIFLFIKRKEVAVKLVRISMIFSICFLLPILPWFGKNLLETKSLSIDALLNGKKATPTLDLNLMEEKRKEMFD